MKIPIILSLLLISTFVSCNSKEKELNQSPGSTQISTNSKSEDAQIEAAFSYLGKRYAALKIPADSLYSGYYTHRTSIDHHYLKIGFDIFERKAEAGSFVLIVKYNNKMRAIPVFPYTEACYWNYENEGHSCSSSELNFQDEYNEMLKDLSLDDSDDLVLCPYNIINKYVLYHETLRLEDTKVIADEHAYCIKNDTPAAQDRNKKSLKEVIHLIHPPSGSYNYLGDVDRQFNHVFWAESKLQKSTKKVKMLFRAFNFECREPLVFI